MCTVTFIPLAEGLLLTSSRDEKTVRSKAIVPAVYPASTGSLLYPKDSVAGGTWIAVHENGNALIFLNGAFEAHQPSPPYRKSRGLILLELIDSVDPLHETKCIDLEGIEPFTAILWQGGCLHEFRWTGEEKHSIKKNPAIPHLWASATLYSDAVIDKRKNWFQQWQQKHPSPAQGDIVDFHRFTGDGDQANDLVIDRNGLLRTVSITSVMLLENMAAMSYLDLVAKTSHQNILSCSPEILHR